MAKASSKEVEVVKIVKEKVITLELSQDEAQAVADVLSAVGGSPLSSRRGLRDKIADALNAQGISWGGSPFLVNGYTISDLEGHVTFRDSDLEGHVTFRDTK